MIELIDQNPEVGPEEEEDADERDPYILHSEVKKAIKVMNEKKASGHDVVPGEVLKLLGDDGLQQMTRLINTLYGTGECSKDFIKLQSLPY
jgi:hypothetical protein